jgi:hypothetical protein
MAKLTLTNIASGYYTVEILNANFDAIEAAFENAVVRDGTSPNAMQADIDAGGHNIVNVGNITSASVYSASDSPLLGGYAAALYPRKAENATIAGTWVFTVAPTFPTGTVLKQDTEVVLTKPLQTTAQVLVSAATVTPDCELGNFFTLTAAENFTLANPSNPPDATKTMTLLFRVQQDATGSRIITWGSKYKFPGGTAGVLTTTAAAVDLVSCTYHSVSDTWMTTVLKDIK